MSEKIFQPHSEQISILRRRGIVIFNEQFAVFILENIGYYALINGYKDPFLLSTSPEDQYSQGTTFEEIWAMYTFDRTLRERLLVELLRIEHEIQTNITYTFSSIHGYDHRKYLRPECFNSKGPKNEKLVNLLINKMQSTIQHFSSDHKTISHYLKVYQYIPLWVLSTVLTFGETNQFFARMLLQEKNLVASKFQLKPKQFESVLHILCTFRNKCAHGERIYSYRQDIVHSYYIPVFPIHKKLQLPFNEKGPRYGREDILALLIVMKYFMPKERYSILLSDISKALSQLFQNLHTIPIKRILDIMGLPPTWKDLDRISI